MTKTLAAVLFLLPLTACAQSIGGPTSSAPGIQHDAIAPPQMPSADACEPPLSLVGQNKSVLDTMRFKNPIRVLGPDSMATMDYSPNRLNIMIDDKGTIIGVKCG